MFNNVEIGYLKHSERKNTHHFVVEAIITKECKGMKEY